VQWRTENTM